jgi:hypothetical protein
MYLISRALVVVVALALMIYLAARSLNFLQYTMAGDEVLYSYLGLMATSGAAAVWLLLILFGQCSTGQLAIAYPFMLLGLGGEFALAVADSYLGASLRDGLVKFTESDLRLAILVAVGLASIQTLALIVFHLVEGQGFKVELPKLNLAQPAKVRPITEGLSSPAPLTPARASFQSQGAPVQSVKADYVQRFEPVQEKPAFETFNYDGVDYKILSDREFELAHKKQVGASWQPPLIITTDIRGRSVAVSNDIGRQVASAWLGVEPNFPLPVGTPRKS